MTVRPKLFRPKILKKKKTSPGTTGNRIFRLRASSAQLGNQTELKTCGPPTFQNVRREKKTTMDRFPINCDTATNGKSPYIKSYIFPIGWPIFPIGVGAKTFRHRSLCLDWPVRKCESCPASKSEVHSWAELRCCLGNILRYRACPIGIQSSQNTNFRLSIRGGVIKPDSLPNPLILIDLSIKIVPTTFSIDRSCQCGHCGLCCLFYLNKLTCRPKACWDAEILTVQFVFHVDKYTEH